MQRRSPRRIATVSLHTSPLDQPGTGDAGGLNVYVVEVSKRLAERGVEVEIFTRAVCRDTPPTVELVPGVLVQNVVARMLPYWYDAVVPDLNTGKTVLIVAHGNSLRALVKHLDGISDAAIAELNNPPGIPLVYELDDAFRPTVPGGRYLDPEAAAEAAEAVKNQGR